MGEAMHTHGRQFTDVRTAVLQASLRELNTEIIRRIEAGLVSADEVCRRLGLSSLDELRSSDDGSDQ